MTRSGTEITIADATEEPSPAHAAPSLAHAIVDFLLSGLLLLALAAAAIAAMLAFPVLLLVTALVSRMERRQAPVLQID